MPYAINYNTWTVEKINENDEREPKFATELETLEEMLDELIIRQIRLLKEDHSKAMYDFYQVCWLDCAIRIQKLKQQ